MRTARPIRLLPFFDHPLETRVQETESGRASRAASLEARALGDGRWAVEGSSGIYYLRPGPAAGGVPVCFCLDAQRGQDRCKHVLAALAQQAYGGRPALSLRGLPYGPTTPVGQVLDAAERALGGGPPPPGGEDAPDPRDPAVAQTAATWLLSCGALNTAVGQAVVARVPHPVAWLGLLRFRELAANADLTGAMLDRLLAEEPATDGWNSVLLGRLLPHLEPSPMARAWAALKPRLRPEEVCAVLHAGGGRVSRALPAREMAALLQAGDRETRVRLVSALRPSGELPLLDLAPGAQEGTPAVARRRRSSTPRS